MCWGCHAEGVMERFGGRRFWRSVGAAGLPRTGPILTSKQSPTTNARVPGVFEVVVAFC